MKTTLTASQVKELAHQIGLSLSQLVWASDYALSEIEGELKEMKADIEIMLDEIGKGNSWKKLTHK